MKGLEAVRSFSAPPLQPLGRTGTEGIRYTIAVFLLIVSTVALNLMANGNPIAALAPTVGFGVLWLMWVTPVRKTVLVLIFLGLTLESPNEVPAGGQWHSPLYFLGAMLLAKWNDVFGVGAMVFTGVDLLCCYLIIALVWRRATGSKMDTEGQEQTATVMALGVFITLAGTLWIWGYGLARGGTFRFSLLQVYRLVYVPFLFFLCHAALRGPKDHASIAKVIVGAAVVRGLLAFYIRKTVVPIIPGEPLAYATTHGDSMLFSGGAAFIIALINEGVGRKRRGLTVLLVLCLGAVLLGAMANKRRLVWVELSATLVTFYLMSTWTPLKRALSRGVIVLAPILLLYFVIGWNAGGGLFAPVQTARSIIDSKSDGSTAWRDLENMNLIMNILRNPILGSGFGIEYDEVIKLPDISGFKEYRLITHNSVLGFLAFAGLFGFSLLWCIVAVGVFLAARSYRRAKEPIDRAIALWIIATLIAYINSVYGDMGQSSWTAVFTVAPALAVCGKLAVATGAWPARKRKATLESKTA